MTRLRPGLLHVHLDRPRFPRVRGTEYGIVGINGIPSAAHVLSGG